MASRTVGVRELKTRLGTYLRHVRGGQTLVITDRGLPVAELRPIAADASLPARLATLASQGAVTVPTQPAAPFRAIRGRRRSLSDAVREDRQDRV